MLVSEVLILSEWLMRVGTDSVGREQRYEISFIEPNIELSAQPTANGSVEVVVRYAEVVDPRKSGPAELLLVVDRRDVVSAAVQLADEMIAFPPRT